jgi:hypothetical protein
MAAQNPFLGPREVEVVGSVQPHPTTALRSLGIPMSVAAEEEEGTAAAAAGVAAVASAEGGCSVANTVPPQSQGLGPHAEMEAVVEAAAEAGTRAGVRGVARGASPSCRTASSLR